MIDQIKEFIVNNFQIEKERLTPDAHLVDDLELTSLDIVDIAMYIEEEFGVILDEEDLSSVSTVQSFLDLIEKEA